MLVKNLPEELQELIQERHKLYHNPSYSRFTIDSKEAKASVSNMIHWAITPEGDEFWRKVNAGKDMSEDPNYPKKKELTYQIY